ncbi:MAG: CRISPR-associated helicase Cas3', partial [Gammaproteobacteria bacterium]
MKNNSFIAHVRFDGEGNPVEHWLEDHLCNVANISAKYASVFGSEDWVELAGRWHDLGKYSADFQEYIRDQSGYERENAHVETTNMKGRVNHSSAGALYALEQFKKEMGTDIAGRIIAYLIAGHHAGLADWSSESGQSSLQYRMQDTDLLLDALRGNPPDSVTGFKLPTSTFLKQGADPSFWIRMLFSCLVDADFLDTESFMSPEKTENRKQDVPLETLNQALDQHLAKFSEKEPEGINIYRKQILDNCQNSAKERSGLFSLTVPTGGGKTLSSLSFALRHAIEHKKDRIIYVIPYTSIIEQTSDVLKSIFKDFPNAVLEHHSNLDPEKETSYSRLASQNWDAPIIVTTAVQYFESLYAARTSRVRKLHNIVNSVVILDEAQMLPPDYLMPVLKVIKELSAYYDVSHVLCTATQPALEKRTDFNFDGFDEESVKEIIENPDELTEVFKRVGIVSLGDKIEEWEQLVKQLMEHESFLCIVDRRSDAQELYELLPTGTLHLSGLMCGQHRSDVIEQIKAKLRRNESVRVVSTQLIEAGVDVDFPVVFRAMAGLDSIAQAAGRCNREGKLKKGFVTIFNPPKPAPAGYLRMAAELGQILLSRPELDPLSNKSFKEFFKKLYWT